MRAAERLWRKFGLGLILAVTLAPVHAQTGEIHIYRDASGMPLYTDKKVNPRVTESVYAYIGKYGRPTAAASCTGFTAEGMEARGAQYQQLIDRHASAYGVDPALVKAVMRVESCFDRNAVSKVGAQGLMQLMPYTAQMLGVSNSFDPDENIRGGVKYLGSLIQRFNNNLEFALAGYNAGPGNVDKYKGIPPFRETQSYLKRVMTHYKRYST